MCQIIQNEYHYVSLIAKEKFYLKKALINYNTFYWLSDLSQVLKAIAMK